MSSAGGNETLSPWAGALAGSAAAVVANSIVYPLDIAKTRIQVQVKQAAGKAEISTALDEHYSSSLDVIRKILQTEGFCGLYTGIGGSLLGVASTNFAYFYWYSVVRRLYLSARRIEKIPSAAIELLLGAIAGGLAQIFTIPVSVITTRQQTQSIRPKPGFIDTGREIVSSEDGWRGLWRGLKASLILVINPAITYGAYERLRLALFKDRASLRSWEAFALGASAKALATVVSQPLIVAKVSLQSRPPPARNGKPFKTFGEVLTYILEHEGPEALFKGLGPQIAKGVMVQGLLMMIKDRVEILFKIMIMYIRRLGTIQARRRLLRIRQLWKTILSLNRRKLR